MHWSHWRLNEHFHWVSEYRIKPYLTRLTVPSVLWCDYLSKPKLSKSGTIIPTITLILTQTLTASKPGRQNLDHVQTPGLGFDGPGFDESPFTLWRCWLGVRKSIRPLKIWVMRCWRGYLLERSANSLHIIQLMPLPPHHVCFSKSQNGLSFWYRLTWVVLVKGS